MDRFKNLISAMPEKEQAFVSKKSTWKKHLNTGSLVSQILTELFDGNDSIEISRGDLFKFAKENDLNKFIVATLIWGYPAGMRGNNFSYITDNFDSLSALLRNSKSGIPNWLEHWKNVKPIKGVSLSTYTKFLYFLDVTVIGYPALILDQKIIGTINKSQFSIFRELPNLTTDRAIKKYPDYLALMHDFENQYNVAHGKIEMFLFVFGLNLKFENA